MLEIHMITRIIITTLLSVLAVIDIKKKEIPNFYFLITGALTVILCAINYSGSIFYHVLGMLVGLLLILIGKVTRGKIGAGDGLIFCILGSSVGLFANVQILMMALFLSSIYAIFLMVTKHVGKNYTIPFIPFILAGYIGVVWF